MSTKKLIKDLGSVFLFEGLFDDCRAKLSVSTLAGRLLVCFRPGGVPQKHFAMASLTLTVGLGFRVTQQRIRGLGA